MNPRRTPSSRLLAPRLVVVGHDPRTRRSASVRAQPSDWRNVVATQAYDGTRSSSRSPRRSAAAPSAVRPRRSSSTTVVGRSCSTPVTSSPPRSGPNAGPTSPAGRLRSSVVGPDTPKGGSANDVLAADVRPRGRLPSVYPLPGRVHGPVASLARRPGSCTLCRVPAG